MTDREEIVQWADGRRSEIAWAMAADPLKVRELTTTEKVVLHHGRVFGRCKTCSSSGVYPCAPLVLAYEHAGCSHASAGRVGVSEETPE